MTLDPLYQAIGWLLALFYSVIPNLGVSIILLTITIMLILFPLTAKQAKSMIAMQKLAPELKKLQAKYKGDRQKLNEETMKLYQENKVNPLASCLPLLLQLPIFFSLFRVLRDAYKHVPTDSALYKALCGGHAKCTADNVNHLKFLGIDLQKSAVDAHNGFIERGPVLHPRRPRGPHRLSPVPAGPEAHARGQQADGHGHEGAAGLLRPDLAAVPGRSGALLLREQPVAARSARGHLPAVPGGREHATQTGDRQGWQGSRDRDRRHRRRESRPQRRPQR